MKWCPRCRQHKDVFHKNASRSDGLSSWCAACCVVHSKAWQATHGRGGRPETRLACNARWRAKHRLHALLSAIRRKCAREGIPYSISESYFTSWPIVCPVLGIRIDWSCGPLRANTPSIDRIIPVLGYIPGNVVIVSMRANRLKSDATPEEMCRLADFYSEARMTG